MSNDVHNILDAISEAKAALDAKPTLERRIRELESQLDDVQRHNQGLEQNIIGYKATINQANDKINDLIRAKDDVELRAMELEDRIHSVSGFLSSMRDSVTTMDRTINPQPTEPTPQPMEQSVSNVVITNPEPTPVEEVTTHTTPVPPLTYESEYESEATSNPNPAPSQNTEHSVEAKPYTNRLYYFCRDYMPMLHWINGGGTEYSYCWRPQGHGLDETKAPVGYTTERFCAAS